jgi:hypothetical protein
MITSDAGALLLREVRDLIGAIRHFAECSKAPRHPDQIDHPSEERLAPRIFGIALGFEKISRE